MNMTNLVAENRLRIAVVTGGIGAEAGAVFVHSIVEILRPLTKEIFLITNHFPYKYDDKVHIIQTSEPIDYVGYKKRPLLYRAFRYFLLPLQSSLGLARVASKVDIVALYLGGHINVLPMLCAKLLRKKTTVFYFGSRVTYKKSTALFGLWKFIFPYLALILQTINLSLADQVAMESESVAEFAGLGRYKHKTCVNGAIFIDTNIFRVKRDLKDRANLVGYIGYMRAVKGADNFARAVPLILRQRPDVRFLIGGDGPLFYKVKKELKDSNCYEKVTLPGYIPHDSIPDYLNQLKLLVLPSYSEGIPAIVQEAMACGTPVLATPVGGVPNLIKEGETGFIIEDNSPECIAQGVIRALSYPNLEQIASNARALIEREYTYQPMVEKCKIVLDKLVASR